MKGIRLRLQGAVCLVLSLGAVCPLVWAADRPNILWITCEDISPDLGCYGQRVAVTPVLDRFATQGVRYTQAYGVIGVCAPNRSCLITGVYPTRLGSHPMRSTTVPPPQVRCFPAYLHDAGYFCTNNTKTDYNFAVPADAWDENGRTAHWRHRRPDQPFFAVFNFTVSHESQIRVPDAQYEANTRRLTPAQRHDPSAVPIPPIHPDAPEVRQDWARYHDNITAMDYQAGDILAELEADGLDDETIVFFFGDNGAGMPGCKKWIWDSGLRVPLLIRFPERYRDLAPAEPGQTCDRLVSFVDFASTVLSLAGIEPPEAQQGVPFLGPYAGEPRQYVYAHRDRMAERLDIVRSVSDGRYQYLRNFLPARSWSQFTSYTEEMPTMRVWRERAGRGALDAIQSRYFAATKPVEELYDMAADPYETHNLADDPAHAGTLARLRAACRAWMLDTGDLGLLPEYEVQVRSEGSTPYQMAADTKLNPLERLLDAADRAAGDRPGNLPALLRDLNDNDAAIRWWAIEGLNAYESIPHDAQAALRAALVDPAPEVQIAAALGVARRGDAREAIAVLTTALEHERPIVRLDALNALDRLGPAALPALPAIRGATIDRPGDPIADYANRMVEYLPEQIEARAVGSRSNDAGG